VAKGVLHHLDIALGSQGEVDVQLELATRLQRFSHPSRATCTAGQAAVGWRSIGRSPTAISLKNNGGGHRRGRPCLVGRAMAVTDHAAALFFRAVARDRHPTAAGTAFRTLRGNEAL